MPSATVRIRGETRDLLRELVEREEWTEEGTVLAAQPQGVEDRVRILMGL